MKTNIKNLFLVPALIAGLNFIPAGRVTAQSFVNFDGANPNAGLILSGKTLYGTAAAGGSSGNGTVFAVNTDGTGFTSLHSFTYGSDGAGPIGGLVLTNNTLYGTADLGGRSGKGTVFSISLPPPQLTITPSGANVVLTWPANATGFYVQVTVNLGDAAGWATSPLPQPPIVVNGQYMVTIPNTIVGQHYYRLSQ